MNPNQVNQVKPLKVVTYHDSMFFHNMKSHALRLINYKLMDKLLIMFVDRYNRIWTLNYDESKLLDLNFLEVETSIYQTLLRNEGLFDMIILPSDLELKLIHKLNHNGIVHHILYPNSERLNRVYDDIPVIDNLQNVFSKRIKIDDVEKIYDALLDAYNGN